MKKLNLNRNDRAARPALTGRPEHGRQLKEHVLEALAGEFRGRLDGRTLQFAVNEADALAGLTPFPTLFLPVLAEEKARNAARWQRKQHKLLQGNESFALIA